MRVVRFGSRQTVTRRRPIKASRTEPMPAPARGLRLVRQCQAADWQQVTTRLNGYNDARYRPASPPGLASHHVSTGYAQASTTGLSPEHPYRRTARWGTGTAGSWVHPNTVL